MLVTEPFSSFAGSASLFGVLKSLPADHELAVKEAKIAPTNILLYCVLLTSRRRVNGQR